MRSFSTSRVVAPLALLCSFVACRGDSTGPSLFPGIRAVADTVRPGALLAVRLENTTFGDATADGLLGDMPITLHRVDGTTLALVTPDLAAGSRTLRVELPAGSLMTTITVLPALAFADAEATIDSTLTAQQVAVPTLAPSGLDSTAWAGHLAELDSLVVDARAAVAALNPTEQLELARLLASLQIGPAVALQQASLTNTDAAQLDPMELNWRDVTCRNTLRRMTKAGVAASISGYGLAVFLRAPIPNPLLKYGGAAVSATAYVAAGLVTLQEWAQAAADCQVQTSTDITEAADGAGAGLFGATAVTTPRYFQNRPRTFLPEGNFRKLSRDEIAKDAIVASIAELIDDLHRLANSLAGLLPDAIARRIPPLPTRLSQTPPGGASLQAVPATGVRIENVRPSSVQFSANAAGEFAIQLRTGAAVTTDVPFTFDVVSTYDPKIKVTRSGVARPMMSGTALSYPATVTGTRTLTTVNNVQYGTLTCSGSVTVRIKGGDRAIWEDFSWVQTGPSTNSDVEPIRGAGGSRLTFESGDYPFSGSWYWRSNENGVPLYKSFSISITITYTDLLTATVKSVPINFTCV